MAFPSVALKPAIVAVLRADTTLHGLLVGAALPSWNIFDNVPELSPYPYVNLGQCITQVDDAMNHNGNIVIQEIHAWSQYYGTKEIDGIVERVILLLHRQPLSLAAPYAHVGTWLDQVMNQPVESDGRTRQAVIRFKILTAGG